MHPHIIRQRTFSADDLSNLPTALGLAASQANGVVSYIDRIHVYLPLVNGRMVLLGYEDHPDLSDDKPAQIESTKRRLRRIFQNCGLPLGWGRIRLHRVTDRGSGLPFYRWHTVGFPYQQALSVHLTQPTLEGLHLLDEKLCRFHFGISHLEVANDFLFARQNDAVEFHRVFLQHAYFARMKGAVHQVGQGDYFGFLPRRSQPDEEPADELIKKPSTWMVAYSDRPFRLFPDDEANGLCCFHIEARIEKLATFRRLDINTLTDAANYDGAFKNLRLMDPYDPAFQQWVAVMSAEHPEHKLIVEGEFGWGGAPYCLQGYLSKVKNLLKQKGKTLSGYYRMLNYNDFNKLPLCV